MSQNTCRMNPRVVFILFLLVFGVPLGSLAKEQNGGENTPLFTEGTPDFGGEAVIAAPNFSPLASYAESAVVNITAESGEGEDDDGDDKKEQESLLPPFLRRGPERPSRSLGTGFFVSRDGYIVTNHHVVAEGKSIVVRIPGERDEYDAELVGADPKTDIALIKITPRVPVQPLLLGDSDEVEIGEWVVAVGNQFQLGQTFTAGIVSAKSRRVPTRTSSPYDQFIQTDASINPGSSGGPLLNTKGQVVGINTAIFSPGRQGFGGGQSGFNIGIGFAVPVNLAKGILVQLKEKGRVTRGLLGVIIQSVTPEVQEALELPKAAGALVADVMEDTPAAEAGFLREDVIVSYEGTPIQDHDELPLLVAETPVGQPAAVVVLRGGKRRTLKPRIGELKDAPRGMANEDEQPQPDRLGIVPEEVTAPYSRAIGQEAPTGVVVVQVKPGSPAEKAGLQRGDIIEELDRRAVNGPRAYERLVKSLSAEKVVLVLVRRKEGTRFLTLTVPTIPVVE
ncbi:trypsin-like peptidase domain-containing protein [bacterium]|nr:trypsin-like peptidase domain-containing protein [bacterium]